MSSFFAGLVDFIGGHPLLALFIVFLVSAGEAVFVVGLFVPSTVVLVGAGTLIGMGQLSFWPIFLAATIGATVGDGLSFWIGHVHKERLKRVWPFSRYRALIEHGERFFMRHGGKSIFIARFLPGVKSVVPVIAGMMGMGVARFAAINGISALAWAGAHIIPSIGLGHGISVFASGNPRLVALVLIAIGLTLAAWYAVRLSVIWLGPGIARFHKASIERLSAEEFGFSLFARRVLTNEGDILNAVLWSVAGLLAAFGFAALLLNLLFDPELTFADHAIVNFVQSLRNTPADAVMVAVTMLGDSVVLTALTVALVAGLVWSGHWRIGAAALGAIVFAAVFVPFTKLILHRSRPTDLYAGAEAFSFPSGHATLSMTVFGLIAAVLAAGRPARVRVLIYAGAAALILAIAGSRIYLRAHWPSDVAAGLLFGLSIVALMAIFLHRLAIEVPAKKLAIGLSTVLLATYGADLARSYNAWSATFSVAPASTAVTEAAWLSSAWQTLPQRRIQLDGETGEPFLLQTDVPAQALEARLTSAGWRGFPPLTLGEDIAAIMPSRVSFSDQAPLPSLHDGHGAILTFTKASRSNPDRRLVLRFWTSGTEAEAAGGRTPILLGAVSAEIKDPVAFGFSGIEPAEADDAERANVAHELESTLGSNGALRLTRAGQEPFLLARQ